MNRIITLLIIAVFSLSSCATRNPATPDFRSPSYPFHIAEYRTFWDSKSKTYRLTADSEHGAVKATVELRKFSTADRKRRISWYSTDGGEPSYVVEEVRFSVGSRSYVVPSDAIDGLGDLTLGNSPPAFLTSPHELAIRYSGGDGAGFYTADFIFDQLGFNRVNIWKLSMLSFGPGETRHKKQ
jgi:hypothetical protein